MEQLLSVEFSILDWIQAHIANGFLDAIVPLITRLGDVGFIWLLLGLVLLFLPRERSRGMQVLLAICFSALICNATLKPLVDRVRPFDIAEGISLLVATPHDASFPSGHTSAAFAAAVVLLKTKWRWRYVALILAALIALSRLYLYVHFPTDVLGGMVTGTLAGMLSCFTYERIRKWRNKSLEGEIASRGA